MAVPDIVIDEITATIRTMDSRSMLDPKLVRTLVAAVLVGGDDRKQREARRRADSKIGEASAKTDIA